MLALFLHLFIVLWTALWVSGLSLNKKAFSWWLSIRGRSSLPSSIPWKAHQLQKDVSKDKFQSDNNNILSFHSPRWCPLVQLYCILGTLTMVFRSFGEHFLYVLTVSNLMHMLLCWAGGYLGQRRAAGLMNQGFNEPGCNLQPVKNRPWTGNLFYSPVDHLFCVPRRTELQVSSQQCACSLTYWLSTSLSFLTHCLPPHCSLFRSSPKQMSLDTNSCLWVWGKTSI